MFLRATSEGAAALDAGKLRVVAGENELSRRHDARRWQNLPSASVEIIAASSTTRTVSRVHASGPCSSAINSPRTVLAFLKPSPRICCTTSFVHDEADDALALGLVNRRGRFERVALAGSRLAPKDRKPFVARSGGARRRPVPASR